VVEKGTERLTGIRSGYFCLMRSASCLRFSEYEVGVLAVDRDCRGMTEHTKGVLILEFRPHDEGYVR
jgi:hypothetical protein